MNVFRVIAGILVGYVLFASASTMLVGPVMAQEAPIIVVLALVALALIGMVSGFGAALISGERRQIAAFVLAALVALATLANLVMQLGAEPAWYKVGTLLLTAPAILWVALRRPGGNATA